MKCQEIEHKYIKYGECEWERDNKEKVHQDIYRCEKCGEINERELIVIK